MRRDATARASRSRHRAGKRTPRNTQRPNFKMLLGLFAMTAAFSCGVSYALQTPLLLVKQIRVDGVQLVKKDAVTSAAQYALKRNILLVSKGAALKKIGAISEVENVRMGRTFPDKLWIRVQERKPSAVITDGSNFFLAQADGYVFHKVDGPVKGIPTISLCNSEVLKLGSQASSPDAKDALEALKCARKSGVAVDKISIDRDGNICLNMDSNFYVKILQPEDIAKNVMLVHTVLVRRPSIPKEMDYMIISPNAVQVMPKRQAQAAIGGN